MKTIILGRFTGVGKREHRNLMVAPQKHTLFWALKERHVTALVTYVMPRMTQPKTSISYWHFQAL